jgi:putative membrane-bound dehydrogenase-like protein
MTRARLIVSCSLLAAPLLLGSVLLVAGQAAEPKPGAPPSGPLSPREELATIRVPKGFRVELVACEPEVVDPVAMAFDEEGRLFVAEMRGYPNAGIATGKIHSGKIKLLEDRDGDGFYERSTVFAEGLRFPTSVMPWKGGLLVAVAPDIVYFEDTDGDGRANRQRSLYTGFDLSNIQQLVNSLQWGLDNWVYACAGTQGGTVRSPEKPDARPVTLRSRGIRFHPDRPGSLEPTSGGGQFGLAPDDWQHWFTATNSQHLRQIVLPDHYLRRNPALAVPAAVLDIPDHGPACKVHRISPFEAWRVERTTRRAGGPDANRFPSTELVPGGYVTSACSPVVYCADLFPPAYRGNTFVCDPANNLIHRDVLEPHGATFVAKRADEGHEFLAATDTWFRPVNLTIGPDGALYVCDFYREVIETPLSLPDDIKEKLNLESRGRGRVWRIVPETYGGDPKRRTQRRPALRSAPGTELVRHLADENLWWRLTAQRLLIERQNESAVEALVKLVREAVFAPGRAHALWTLHGLHALNDEQIVHALKDPDAGVRAQALRLAEDRLGDSAALRSAVAALADDPSPQVRFQVAFSAGQTDDPALVAALAKVAWRDAVDRWTQTAVLSSAGHAAPRLMEALVHDSKFIQDATAAHLELLSRLAAVVGARSSDADLARALRLLGKQGPTAERWQIVLLDGIGQGLRSSGRSLVRLWERPLPDLKEAIDQARPFFDRAAEAARDPKRSPADRLAAIRLLGSGPFGIAGPALHDVLAPQNPSDIQLAAVRALSAHDSSKVAAILLTSWGSYSPAVRREVVEALFARPERLSELLTAVEKGQVPPAQIEPARLDQLREHPTVAVRERARKLLAGRAAPDRRKVLEEYRASLALKADAGRGKAAFKKNCATCHRLEDEGIEVGPDLLSALRNKSREQLLTDILDPSREVDPRYLNYQVTTSSGRVFTGMIVAETASSVTLRRAEKAEDTLLRSQIDTIEATAKSLMPEGLEMQLGKQDVADLIAYLQSIAAPR